MPCFLNDAPPPCALSQAFYKCLENDNSEMATWLRQMKAKLQTTIFQRQMADGDQMDFSANGIYLLHVKKLCAMLAKVGGREAA